MPKKKSWPGRCTVWLGGSPTSSSSSSSDLLLLDLGGGFLGLRHKVSELFVLVVAAVAGA